MNKKQNLISNQTKSKGIDCDLEEIIKELDELKNIALNSFDKNGNPNIQAALKAVECKIKIINQTKKSSTKTNVTAQMGEVKIDGIQLKLDIGEDYSKDLND